MNYGKVNPLQSIAFKIAALNMYKQRLDINYTGSLKDKAKNFVKNKNMK